MPFLTEMLLGELASAFFFSPGRDFFVTLVVWEPATGRHVIAYAAWITATAGSASWSVDTGSATSASKRRPRRPRSRTGRMRAMLFDRGLSLMGTGLMASLDFVSAPWVEVSLTMVDDMVTGSINGIARGTC